MFAQKLGLRAGANLSNMVISNNASIMGKAPQKKLGAHFEIIGDYALNRLFSVETAVGLSTKGYQVKFEEYKPLSGYQYNIIGQRNLTYLDIPLRVKMQIERPAIKYFFAAGPQWSIGLIGKWHTEKQLQNQNTTEVKQVYWNNAQDINSLARTDIGYFAGFGVEINSLMVELSYAQSLKNISANTNAQAQNCVISLSVGRYLLRSTRNITTKEILTPTSIKSTTHKYPKMSAKKKRKHKRHRRRHRR